MGLRAAGHREKLRKGQPREGEVREDHCHKGHRDYLGPPTPNELVGYTCGEERIYILEQKCVLVLSQLPQLQHPGVYAHMEPPADTGTTQSVTVRSETQYQIQRLSLTG